MTDFIVFSFITIIVFILAAASGALIFSTIFRPEEDNSQLVTILADITTSLIAALVGFLAGKGQGRSDAEEARKEQEIRIEEIKAGVPPVPASKDGDK
jgi:hypothetical protein